ncbi:hypothetical protein SAMN03159444_02526 [Pseudomonas sp. NFACC02]|uniref:hypothetical protein n=1 Tax=Pseudomonas sp. NFACC02 TaxID=1566250 RepID=UPI0008ACDF51|nr:hypothetical protein SAMN03159444_02526 [Pseudomonas sp. NFACC02]
MSFETGMNSDATRAFIANSDMADGTLSLMDHISALNQPMPLANPEPAVGAVVGSSLLAFTDGVSRQNREDVMDSFLFATLVANKKYNPETQTAEWYGLFNKVLSKVGWLSRSWNYARYRSNHQRFTMDQAAIEILGSAIAAATLPGPASAAMLKVAADTVNALKAQEKPRRLFDRQTKSHNGANFLVGACTESAGGTVSLAMGAVNFLTSSNVTDVLFWEWSSTEVKTFRAESNLSLNTRMYARNRQFIQDRLDDSARSAIEEFDI